MKLYEVTVIIRVDEVDEREVWEIEALSEPDARRIAAGKIAEVGTGYVVRVKDTLRR